MNHWRAHHRSRWRMRQRMHQRWHEQHGHWRHRFKHLGARLVAVFLVLALASSLILFYATRQTYGWLWGAPLLLIVTGMAFGTIRHMIRPLRALAVGAEAFARGDLSHRIRLRPHSELGELAELFNRMAADIQAMLDGKRALLLAISHELRSPLTRARLNAELVEEGPPRQALLQDLALMRDLITGILESERLGAGHSALALQSCNLNALIAELVQNQFADAEVELDLAPDLPAMPLDRLRMQLLLRNLGDNALRHNDATKGKVLVITTMTEQGARLTVRDFGPGVPAEVLPKLGEPFYRPDEARTRSSGGVGLGLSLCKLIASAHGATLALSNATPGFEASVVLPMA
ncbi:MAG: HAMP domain-containing protein [Burkholderiaceae bacterium]|nr:HAMP domain-containing protein [Burkholderiaceae bacterium]